jgi:hypothetical protein
MDKDRQPALSDTEARQIVDEAAREYFAERRRRVGDFVDRHFSLRGTLSLHRHALGWDLLKAPANLLLAVPNVAAKLAAAGAAALGAQRSAERLRSARILLETAIGREIEWLIATELLELPIAQRGRASRRDGLAEAILSHPRIAALVEATMGALSGRAADPEVRARLEEAMASYGGTRAAAAEIATGLLTLASGAALLKQATPGVMTLGPALAASIAQQSAVAAFPLGPTLGGLWYGVFPAAAAPGLVVGLTGGLAAIAASAAAFAGIVTDPIQRRLGLHRRRLVRLIDAIERIVAGDERGVSVRDHYVARLLDFLDVLGTVHRIARG